MTALRSLFLGAAGALALLAGPAMAGQLEIQNIGKDRIQCRTADGQEFSVDPGRTKRISALSGHLMDWVECGKLRATNIDVSANSLDHLLVFNGVQTRTLNILNYPYMPNIVSGYYQSMTVRMIQEYMEIDPTVLLNLVTSNSPAFDSYNEANWDRLLGPDGFHAVELDTINLTPLQDSKRIRPLKVDREDMLSWALDAVTIGDSTFASPTVGCTNVMFGKSPFFRSVEDFSSLEKYLTSQKEELKIIADYSGTTSLGSGYLSAFTDLKGFNPKKIEAFISNPEALIDKDTIERMAEMFGFCEKDGEITCLDKTFKDPFAADSAFADKTGATMIAYTERASCNQVMNKPLDEASLQQVHWGAENLPLIFTDGFVANANTCGDESCDLSVDEVIQYLTSLKTRTWIAMGDDLPIKQPRYLLPVKSSFYNQQSVLQNNLYKQFKPIVLRAKPMPNYFGMLQRQKVYRTVCGGLTKYLGKVKCIL